MASTTTIQPIFTVNERVLCYHGPLIYEAKVLKSHHHDETTTPSGQVGPHYFVHYKGWKQTYVSFFFKKRNSSYISYRWDEWVPASRLLKMTETNIALQKSLQHTNVPSAHGGAASAKINPKNAGMKDSVSTRAGARKDGGTRGTKRSREDVRFFCFTSFSLADTMIGFRLNLVGGEQQEA